MSTIDTKRIGRDILYCLGTGDAAEIIRARRAAGNATQHGNDPKAGDWFPGKIVADFGRTTAEHAAYREKILAGQYANGDPDLLDRQLAQHDAEPALWSVNVQIQLDGNDTYWATSRQQFDAQKMGYWREPEYGNKVASVGPLNAPPVAGAEWVSDPEGHWIFA